MTAFARRYFAGGATATTLASSMSSTDTTFTITADTGWPGSPADNFFVVIDRDTTAEEKILCASNSGTTVTVASGGRGSDGTTATAHNQNSTVEVCITAIDGDEANQITNLLGNGVAGQFLTGGGTGTLPAWASLLNPVAKTAGYTANANELVLANASSASITITIPVTAGVITAVKKTDATTNSVYIAAPGSATVDGTSLFELQAQYACGVFVGDGTNAWLVSSGASWSTSSSVGWTSSGVSQPSLGNGTAQAGFQQNGSTIDWYMQLVFGSTTTFGSGAWSFTLPGPGTGGDTPSAVGNASIGSSVFPVFSLKGPSFPANLWPYAYSGSAWETLSASLPGTWGAGDSFYIGGSYPLGEGL